MAKKSNLGVTKEVKIIDNRKGSPLWSYNHFRTSILTSLLNDLITLENVGFQDENVCLQVQTALHYFINASTEVPKGGFLSGPLYKDIESFQGTYIDWNDVHGDKDIHLKIRRKHFKDLRKKRQKISNKIRRLQYELQNNLDQKLLHDAYSAIGALITLVPDILKNLSSAYLDYIKGIRQN